MKQTITFVFILFIAFKAEAKKMIYPFEIVVGSAELIVIGEINSVKNNSYVFNITETLKGVPYKSITVQMFDEWTCDTRFAKPEKGQKLCLFLKKNNNWEIINGSTGELPISKNSITLGGYEEYKHIDYKFTPYTLPLDEFKNGIREFCKCFVFSGEYGLDGNAHFEQIVPDIHIFGFKNKSKFTAWLYEKMSRYNVAKNINTRF